MMKRRIFALVLALCCGLVVLTGCDMMGQVADAALEAAKVELENQIKAKIAEYKLTVVEGKSAFGQLNDEGGKYQFFYAILVQSNTDASARECAEALNKVFGTAGYEKQTKSEFPSKHLVHKTITFTHSDFSADNYYVIYLYLPDLTGWIEKIPQITFPTMPR